MEADSTTFGSNLPPAGIIDRHSFSSIGNKMFEAATVVAEVAAVAGAVALAVTFPMGTMAYIGIGVAAGTAATAVFVPGLLPKQARPFFATIIGDGSVEQNANRWKLAAKLLVCSIVAVVAAAYFSNPIVFGIATYVAYNSVSNMTLMLGFHIFRVINDMVSSRS